MSNPSPLPSEALRACSRHGIVPTRYFLSVNIPRQTTTLLERVYPQAVADRRYRLKKTFRCSTSNYGIGEKAGSNMTPRGLHCIGKKIGGGWPIGAAFESRQMTGFTWSGKPYAPITTRIFWLEGLEPGFNRGGDVDSFNRYIYVHGTGNELTIGRPDSHGCVHLAGDVLIQLYDKLPARTLVWISEK